MKNSKKAELKEEASSDATVCATPAANTGCIGQGLSPHPSPFAEGEAVLAFHKGHYYLAKGWSKSWDEWREIKDVLKKTEENLKKVSHDKKKMKDKDAKTGRISEVKLDTSSDSSTKKDKNNSTTVCRKRKRDQIENKGKENDPVEKLVNISIPQMLKKQLVDDFEFINRREKLVKLPRTPNVDAIIEKYCAYRAKEGVISESVGEVMSGLCVYFNEALPVLLLYNKERQQFREAIMENLSRPLPSAVYGAEHLLRLFVKLPALLHELKVEEATLRVLQQNLLHFLRYLQKNQDLFFLPTYHEPANSRRCIDKDHD